MDTISGTSYAIAHHTSDTLKRSAHETCLTRKKPPPTIAPAIPEPEHDGDDSVFTRGKSQTRLGSKDTFDANAKHSVLMMAHGFRETSTLLIGLRESQIQGERIT